MKKGFVIVLIVAGVLLAACAAFIPFSYAARTAVNRGLGLFNSRDRIWDDDDDGYSMRHGMRGGSRYYSNDEDFYLERWSAMLGISEEELQQRLDAGESLDEIAESLGFEMPCEELYEDEDAEVENTSGGWYFDRNLRAGFCF